MLVLLAFLTKALIPVGFMPNQNRADVFSELTLCLPAQGHDATSAASAVALLWQDWVYEALPQEHVDEQSMDCAFSVFVYLSLPPADSSALALATTSHLPLRFKTHDRAQVQNHGGPPLGSRAPPPRQIG